MNIVKLGKWRIGKIKNYQLIDIDSGTVVENKKFVKGTQINGYYKLINGVKLCCFKYKNNLFLMIGSKLINLNDSGLDVRVKSKWPNLYTEIMKNDLELIRFKEFAPLRILNSRVDFTYDSLDFENDYFGGYVRVNFLHSNEK